MTAPDKAPGNVAAAVADDSSSACSGSSRHPLAHAEPVIRDFAYSKDDPRHEGVFEGIHAVASEDEDGGQHIEDADPWSSFESGGPNVSAPTTNTILGKAKALYDFEAENPTELAFEENDMLFISYKQCDGWLVGYKGNQVGLIPENYVEFI
ncbi:HOG (high osmolarity glycerol) pathway protein [Linderina pennispora]|nr:HOG (high osmolarity glycerol) pathway protein [Linderina pennispora]